MAGVEIGAVVVAGIGALGGGIVAAWGAVLRDRGGARTAARLIYAELTRNGASVAYFRASGTWPVTSMTYTAWDQHGKALAQLRRSAAFDAVHRGYAALEAVQYIAHDSALAVQQRRDLLDHAIGELVVAVRAIGEVARIPRERLDAEARRLTTTPVAATRALHPPVLSGAVPPFVLARIVDRGGVEVQVTAARSTPSAEALRHSDLPAASPRPIADGMRLAVYDARGRESLRRLKLVRSSGDPPTGDPTVDDTYDAMVATWAFAREVLGRDSLSDDGEPLSAVVRYGRRFNNAFWNGQLLAIGEGDNVIFRRFSGCLDVLAHEFFHGVPGIVALEFWGQHGALSESTCDIFGALVLQYHRRQPVTEASWIMGEHLLAEGVKGVGLRSLRAPGTAYDDPVLGKDPQPAHINDYVTTQRDNGGVHINSGIPSHAFYQLACALGGNAWERAGLIWWDAVEATTAPLDFATFAGRTLTAASNRYGAHSPEYAATEDAWRSVGIDPQPGQSPGD
ncbi:M4 family metallopeptidase [Spirillospora sp. NPDC048911]|uniref:M4 family metallopeptidase n=1 Tax=Spirillospora sp. NPDC048911 TaxID=3364527 RepID=UPI0037201CB3